MKILLFVVFVGLVGVIESKTVHSLNEAPRLTRASAASDREASVLRSESVVNVDGFNYVYETNNGIAAQATGAVKGAEGFSVQGQYKYTSPEGVPVEVSYTADEEGFKPVGDLLPVPPPTPEAILRSLQYIAAHPPPAEPYRKQ